MITDEMSAMQPDWKLGFDSNGLNALDTTYCEANFFPAADEAPLLPFVNPPIYDPMEMELLADPPPLDVACLRTAAVPFSVSSLNDFTASRLLYAIELIKRAPASMVQDSQTPWSHQRLYDDAMPRCLSGMVYDSVSYGFPVSNSIAEAYAASALSLSRTKANAEYVSRHVEARFEELFSTPMPTTLSSVLAHAHAFILYLSMQVFSNDVFPQGFCPE
jgi:hypothetical protein